MRGFIFAQGAAACAFVRCGVRKDLNIPCSSSWNHRMVWDLKHNLIPHRKALNPHLPPSQKKRFGSFKPPLTSLPMVPQEPGTTMGKNLFVPGFVS